MKKTIYDYWRWLVPLLLRRGIITIPIEAPFKKAKGTWKQWQRVFPPQWMYTRQLKSALSWAAVTGEGSGIVVVDTDNAQAEAWVLQNLPPTTLMTITPKGVHRYYKTSVGQKVPTRIAIKINGVETKIDIKGDGGYVLLPGSSHPADHLIEKEIYASWSIQEKCGWARKCNLSYRQGTTWDDNSIRNIPTFDINWFPQAANSNAVPYVKNTKINSSFAREYADRFEKAKKYISKMSPAIQGSGGDKATYLAACRMIRDFEMNEPDAFYLLWNHFNNRCLPPWTENEIIHKIKCAARSAKGQGGTHGRE